MADLTETKLSSEQLVDGVLLKAFRDEVRLPDDETSVAAGCTPVSLGARRLRAETAGLAALHSVVTGLRDPPD